MLQQVKPGSTILIPARLMERTIAIGSEIAFAEIPFELDFGGPRGKSPHGN
jgi:hypothetical protein